HADQHVPPDLRVGHLPSAEHHGRLDLVALLKEAARVADLELEVVLVDAGPELDFLDLDLVLLLPRLAGLAGLLVLVLAVVHDPDHRRPRVRRHLHQIETLALGDGERFVNRHDAELDAIGTDDPDRADPDLSVHADFLLGRDCSSSPSGEQKRTRADGSIPAPSPPASRCWPETLAPEPGGAAHADRRVGRLDGPPASRFGQRAILRACARDVKSSMPSSPPDRKSTRLNSS